MRKEYCIISDPSCELLPEEQRQLGITHLVPLQITHNGTPLDLEPAELYSQMEQGEITAESTKTASCSVGEALEVFEKAHAELQPHVTIAYIGISGELSAGTENAVNIAAAQFREEHPERELLVIPSYCISNGLGLLLHLLADYDGEHLEDRVEFLGRHLVHLFTIKDLTYPMNSGRFSKITINAVKAGQMISGLSPLMYFPLDDKLQMGRPCRYRKVVDHWLSYYDHFADPDYSWVRIGYTGSASRPIAKKLEEAFTERGVEHIQLAPIGPAVGAHVGPTCISVFFIQKDVRDSEWHKTHH